MKKKLVTFLSTGAYAGYSPVMPGTAGTLWGVAIWYLTRGSSPYAQALAVILVFGVSVYVAEVARGVFGGEDPPFIVCDEICGFLVSFFLIQFTVFNVILVFILFRFFDILKPYPAGLIDRSVGGGFGIVLDDVAAGVYANISAHIIILALR